MTNANKVRVIDNIVEEIEPLALSVRELQAEPDTVTQINSQTYVMIRQSFDFAIRNLNALKTQYELAGE